MKLKDAKDQVEREHPELTGSAKLQAIKALRDQAKAAAKDSPEEDTPAEPGTVTEGWLAVLLVAVGMRLIAWGVWGSFDAGPVWYDVLYVVLLVTAVSGLVSAYRRRS